MENLKLQSTVLPEEQLTYDQWAKHTKVSINWHSKESIYNATSMMKLWDDRRIINYIKQITVS
jgi:hypothetical protein